MSFQASGCANWYQENNILSNWGQRGLRGFVMNVHFILFIWFLSQQFYMSKIVQQKHSMQFEVNLNSLKSDSSVSVAMESFCSFCVSKWTKTSQMSCARIIFRRDLWAPLKEYIQFKVYKIKLVSSCYCYSAGLIPITDRASLPVIVFDWSSPISDTWKVIYTEIERLLHDRVRIERLLRDGVRISQ